MINDKQHDHDVRGCTAVVGEMMKRRWSSGAPVHVLHCFSTAAAAAATAAAAVGGAASFCTYTNFYSRQTSFYLLHPKKKSVICACVRLILILVGGRQTVYGQNTVYLCLSKYVPPVDANVYDSMIPGTYYVPDTYVQHLPLYY